MIQDLTTDVMYKSVFVTLVFQTSFKLLKQNLLPLIGGVFCLRFSYRGETPPALRVGLPLAGGGYGGSKTD